MKLHLTSLVFGLLVLTALAAGAQEVDDRPPNVVLIVVDDQGWRDLSTGRHNGERGSKFYRTPNIDRLAAEGMAFTSAYTCGPNCAPTRACLMSGLYTPRHGVYTVGSGARGKAENRKLRPVENRTTLDPSFTTLAEAFQAAGYVTAHFGKWHLGAPGVAGPREQGFAYNFGGAAAGGPYAGGYFAPFDYPNLKSQAPDESLTLRLSDEAVGVMRRHRREPFFLYLPYYAVHSPLQGREDLVREYQARSADGDHKNATYAAMIELLDIGVGRVLAALEELQLVDDTIVIFYSDNGGVGGYAAAGIDAAGWTSQAPLRGGKGTLYEGGIRVPLFVRWPGVTAPGTVCDTPVASVDFFPTLAAAAGLDRPEMLDGVDVSPLLTGDSIEDRDLFWHFPGYLQGRGNAWRTTPAGAVRSGDYKLIEYFEDRRLELYHLAEDLDETTNLADRRPEATERLHRLLETWRAEVQAPMPTQK